MRPIRPAHLDAQENGGFLLPQAESIAQLMIEELRRNSGGLTEKELMRLISGRTQSKSAVLRLLINEKKIVRERAEHQKLPHRYHLPVRTQTAIAPDKQDAGSQAISGRKEGRTRSRSKNASKDDLRAFTMPQECSRKGSASSHLCGINEIYFANEKHFVNSGAIFAPICVASLREP